LKPLAFLPLAFLRRRGPSSTGARKRWKRRRAQVLAHIFAGPRVYTWWSSARVDAGDAATFEVALPFGAIPVGLTIPPTAAPFFVCEELVPAGGVPFPFSAALLDRFNPFQSARPLRSFECIRLKLRNLSEHTCSVSVCINYELVDAPLEDWARLNHESRSPI
jgi:hypothetical protein